jgi:serpin B
MRFRRLLQYAISMTWILLLLVGCGAPADAPVAIAASSEERISSPDAPYRDLWELAAGNNAFAFDLYQSLRSGEGNLLFSPYSISGALAMVYAGARGQTEQQMADTLHFTLPQERLHPAFNALDLQLDSYSLATTQLDIANAVWGQAGYTFLPEYLDLLALNYGAGARLVDFQADAPAAVEAINQWVSQETGGRIRDIVGSLAPDTRLVLLNAIYFNAPWDLPFDEADTRDEPFHLLDGDEEKVPLMHQRSDFSYTEGDGYQAIQLAYENRNLAMVILLPREGRFREIEERLTADWVPAVLNSFGRHDVILTMPKFSFETPVLNLAETLGVMGMPDAFSQRNADFSAVAELKPPEVIYISRVLHKAFIEVGEEGTEAAAVTFVEEELTVVEVIDEPTEPPPIIMKIDRPFIFLIRDIKTGTILFVGRVMNPASE